MARARLREVSLRAVARHSLPSLLDGTVVPLVTFTVLVHVWGLRPALWGSLVWAYSALVRRAIGGRRIPGILVVSTVGVTFRLATMLCTGSAWLFFVQPVISTLATAGAFILSSVGSRPLAARLGADFVPLPEDAWNDPEVRRVCRRLSVLWGVALAANAGFTLWILSTFSVPTFVLLKPLVSATTTVPAVVASVLAGRAVMRRSGTRLTAAAVQPVAEPAGDVVLALPTPAPLALACA